MDYSNNRGALMKAYVIIASAAFLLVAGTQARAVEKPCDFCHAGHGGITTLLNNNLNDLCSGCHAEHIGAGEHKVGMSPSMAVRDLPLQQGIMTCVTCHDPHGKSAAMLRIPLKDLCSSCHAK